MQIRRALISVFDKTGIVEFARALHDEFGVEIISTGGTARSLTEAGIPVTLVESITGCGEMLDGRVKTLHPNIHAAILADRDNPEHMRQLEAAGIKPIDLVVVNLYPFDKTVEDPNCTFEQAIEMIDIGGVALLRAAGKNHRHVLVVSTVPGLDRLLYALREGDSKELSRRIGSAMNVFFDVGLGAFDAFWHTSAYDDGIAEWLSMQFEEAFKPAFRTIYGKTVDQLRYGENAHQAGQALQVLSGQDRELADLTTADGEWADSQPIMSYNNFLDADAALGLCAELSRTGVWHRPRSADGAVGQQGRRAKLHFAPLDSTEERAYRRNLPHWQLPGATYFVTFSSVVGNLSEQEREVTLQAIRFWDRQRLDLHKAVVMPDHVHILVTPRPVDLSGNRRWDLAELMQSIKANSARAINRLRGSSGQVWLRESYDRWMRDEGEFSETSVYVANNPVKEGLAATPDAYPWYYSNDELNPFALFEGKPAEARGSEENLRSTRSTACCCFIKHTNACGVGVADEPIEAYRQAYLGDPNAAMGGILAVNFPVDAAFAAAVMETYDRLARPLKEAGAAHAPGGFFVEVWIAPEFSKDAVAVIRGTYDAASASPAEGEAKLERAPKKKWGENVRLLAVGDMATEPDDQAMQYRSIAGGLLAQSPDTVGLNESDWKIVTKRGPTDAELDDLRLAWLVCKHSKSNAITICKGGRLIGNGVGQMSRVMSCRIATWLARENGHAEALAGSVAASDAFFPFADGPGILIDAGVTAIIQPGGSKRDEDTIKLCDERGIAMIFTGTRHFRH